MVIAACVVAVAIIGCTAVLITHPPCSLAQRPSFRSVVCDIIRDAITWAQSARKHSIGRASAVSRCRPPGPYGLGRGETLYVAADERGRELGIIAVPLDGADLLIIYVMPTIIRRRNG